VATSHPFGLVNVVREDVVRASLERDEVLAMAPSPGRPFRGPSDHGRRREERPADRTRRAKRCDDREQ